jgi:hypothetical protein
MIFGSRDRYTFENPLASDPAGRMRFEPVTLSHPHNPILDTFRASGGDLNGWLTSITADNGKYWSCHYSRPHIDHARRVLTRLANFRTTNEQEPNA